MSGVKGDTEGELTKRRKIRCAIYTRKSSEEALDQDFNSLDAQREACAAYVASQKHEGWVLLSRHYDDGGISGGTLERPALQQLMADIDDGLVDQIIVYKIDRLTRSLSDFAKLVDRLDAAQASFVSVTQSFNTSTSMGRLTLNMLLSFAQFEREVTSERIRDKIAASKKRGLWMGGIVPLGYEADGRSLTINDEEAKTVRTLFNLYQAHKNIRFVKAEADRLKLQPKPRAPRSCEANCTNDKASSNNQFSRGHIQFILSNPVYAGRIRHKLQIHQGLHEPIIEPHLWDEVQELLKTRSARTRGTSTSSPHKSLLVGKLFDETGDRLTPSHTNKKGQRYRYYVSSRLIKNTLNSDKPDTERIGGWRFPALELETTVCQSVLSHLKANTADDLFKVSTVDLIAHTQTRISDIESNLPNSEGVKIMGCLEKAVIYPGTIKLSLDGPRIAKLFGVAENAIATSTLSFEVPFRMKKRGVETRLVIDNGHKSEIDQTLLRNMANAHYYFQKIKSGSSIEQIAIQESVTTARILKRLELAFLAPDLVKRITEGTQPIGLTTKWFQNRTLPLDWNEQRQLINRL